MMVVTIVCPPSLAVNTEGNLINRTGGRPSPRAGHIAQHPPNGLLSDYQQDLTGAARTVYAYGAGTAGPTNRYPQDIHQVRARYFSSADQRLTLAMAAGITADHWAVAREVGAPITVNLLTVREVIEFATIEGAKDNGLDQKIGAMTPGKEADIIMLRMDQINVMPVNNVYGAVVLGMDTSNVDTVFIGGRLKKSKGKLVGVDLNRVSRLVHQSRDYVVSKAGWPRTRFGGYLSGY
jgi:hypothetical protein